VFAKVGTGISYTSFPSAVFAIAPDGGAKWRADFSDGGTGSTLVRSGDGTIYTAIPNAFSGSLPAEFVGLDPATGALRCNAQAAIDADRLIGGSAGVFAPQAAFQGRQTVMSFDSGCNSVPLFTTDRPSLGSLVLDSSDARVH